MGALLGLIPDLIGGIASKKKDKQAQAANNNNNQPSSSSGNNYSVADAANLLPMYQRKTGDTGMTASKLKDKLNQNDAGIMSSMGIKTIA